MGNIFQGRINRMQYFLLSIILTVIFYAFYALAVFTLYKISGLFILLLIILFFISQISLVIRRFHDINQSGYYTFLFLIPIVNIVFSLILLFKKGDLSDNQYGPAFYKSSLYDTLLNK